MEPRKENTLLKILVGRSGKYYTMTQWRFCEIPETEEVFLTDMVYDYRTRIVYYAIYDDHEYIIFSMPYLSENGKYCRFVDEQFVEVP